MNRKLLCVAALGCLLATPVHGYEYQLGGVIRDPEEPAKWQVGEPVEQLAL